MPKKKGFGIIIILILIVGGFYLYTKKEAGWMKNTLPDCISKRDYLISVGWRVCLDCSKYTQKMYDCDPSSNNIYDIGKYYFITDSNCNKYQSLLGCFGITNICSGSSTQSCTVGTCAGTQSRTCNSGTWSDWGNCIKTDPNCGGTTCNTPADIAPCNNCVSTSELISFINKWSSNTETTTTLISVINAWVSGTC